MIKFGVKDNTDPYELAQYMGNLNYDSISGDRTRTELALKLAQSVRTYLNVFFFTLNTVSDDAPFVTSRDGYPILTKFSLNMYNINLK